jgi:preprotein translocase subunit SecF
MASFKDWTTKDQPIVQKFRLLFGISIGIVVVGLIFGIFNIVNSGSILNVGIDFEGGYSISIEIGESLNDDNINDYRTRITSIVQDARVDDGQGSRNSRGVKVGSIQRQGSGATDGFLVRYKGVEALSGENVDVFMSELNIAIRDALIKQLFGDDEFAGNVSTGTLTSASLGSEMISRAMLAVFVALLLMMIYIALRFDFVSGLAAIVGLMHDVLVMFALMAIFRIEVNAAFIAALLALIGYSINNTIIIFDRIRENIKDAKTQQGVLEPNMGTNLANRSVRETITRTVNTSATTLIMLLLLLAIGVPDIRTFLWPLVIGLIAGSYSSMFLLPALWAKVVNKHPDYLERGALTSNIRRWLVAKSQARRLKRQARKQAKSTAKQANTVDNAISNEST